MSALGARHGIFTHFRAQWMAWFSGLAHDALAMGTQPQHSAERVVTLPDPSSQRVEHHFDDFLWCNRLRDRGGNGRGATPGRAGQRDNWKGLGEFVELQRRMNREAVHQRQIQIQEEGIRRVFLDAAQRGQSVRSRFDIETAEAQCIAEEASCCGVVFYDENCWSVSRQGFSRTMRVTAGARCATV